jgi:hypothetical protein
MIKDRIYRSLAAGSVTSSVVTLVFVALAGHKFH